MGKNFEDDDIDKISQRIILIKKAKEDSESASNYKTSIEMADSQYEALRAAGKLKKGGH